MLHKRQAGIQASNTKRGGAAKRVVMALRLSSIPQGGYGERHKATMDRQSSAQPSSLRFSILSCGLYAGCRQSGRRLIGRWVFRAESQRRGESYCGCLSGSVGYAGNGRKATGGRGHLHMPEGFPSALVKARLFARPTLNAANPRRLGITLPGPAWPLLSTGYLHYQMRDYATRIFGIFAEKSPIS